jgi:hypothetical protein
VVEGDALNPDLIDELSAWHQHLVDKGLNLRECRTC